MARHPRSHENSIYGIRYREVEINQAHDVVIVLSPSGILACQRLVCFTFTIEILTMVANIGSRLLTMCSKAYAAVPRGCRYA